MSKNVSRPPQSSLYLRLLGGGYLVYIAWDLRGAVAENPLFWIAILVFGAIGIFLLAESIRKLIRKEYAGAENTAEQETTEDCEERSDD
jgi:threonine/homoserine/homoserine lactone efflux protein